MNALVPPLRACLVLVIAPKPTHIQMLTLAARLALNGEVCVLDGGNSFEAYTVARTVRSFTPEVEATLTRIHIQRAFTCYQLLTLLEETPSTSIPTLVLDALTTFHDESVALSERIRLLKACTQQLKRLSQSGPVVVCARPAGTQPESGRLLTLLQEPCDLVWQPFVPEQPLAPVYLPGFAPRG